LQPVTDNPVEGVVPVYIFRSGNDAATGNEGDCLDPAGRNAGIWSEEGGDGGRDLGDGYNEIGVDRGQFLCVDVGDSPPAPGEDGLLCADPLEEVPGKDTYPVLFNPDRLDLVNIPDDLFGVEIAGDEVLESGRAQDRSRHVPPVDEDRNRRLLGGILGGLPGGAVVDGNTGDFLNMVLTLQCLHAARE